MSEAFKNRMKSQYSASTIISKGLQQSSLFLPFPEVAILCEYDYIKRKVLDMAITVTREVAILCEYDYIKRAG